MLLGDLWKRSTYPKQRAVFPSRFPGLRGERPLAALIGAAELKRLERSAEITRRLARTLGQSAKLLKSIEDGKVFA
jgi:hypothetical protein